VGLLNGERIAEEQFRVWQAERRLALKGVGRDVDGHHAAVEDDFVGRDGPAKVEDPFTVSIFYAKLTYTLKKLPPYFMSGFDLTTLKLQFIELKHHCGM
jgi:hypothetical protein